jgi:hypothetical protein
MADGAEYVIALSLIYRGRCLKVIKKPRLSIIGI